MGTLTIRLDERLEKELASLAKKTRRPKSEIAREALRRHVAVQQFRQLRKQALLNKSRQSIKAGRSLPRDEFWRAVKHRSRASTQKT